MAYTGPFEGGGTYRDYIGTQLIGEAGHARLRSYVPGPGTDEVLTWYEFPTSGPALRRWLLQDERGSTIGVTDATGAVIGRLAYNDYGTPAATNPASVRFQYTGQQWLPELGMHYYKNRIYYPQIGRFMQTDPIGVAGGVNLYAYVGGDPINFTDPLGLDDEDMITVTGSRNAKQYQSFSPFSWDWVTGIGSSSWGNAFANGGDGGSGSGGAPGAGVAPQNGKPKRAPCFSIQDQRQHHNQWLAREAQRLRAAGYAVATEVSIRVWASTRPTSVMARADIVATIPGSNIYVVNEIKTGNAGFSQNQEIVYGAVGGNIAGVNGAGIGLNTGDWIALSDFSTSRCPGLGQ